MASDALDNPTVAGDVVNSTTTVTRALISEADMDSVYHILSSEKQRTTVSRSTISECSSTNFNTFDRNRTEEEPVAQRFGLFTNLSQWRASKMEKFRVGCG
ncbi:unnamed protein product [Schistocephalus solidus]|uniref:Uncharacterized protein n=1 Tax=Schistocephalus solidus TaxID=70667 RepID=A0A183TQV1_SCHSO|nr:unnamed protein product [Schistocephalus solidus]